MANLNCNNASIRDAPPIYRREQSLVYGRNSTDLKVRGIGKGGNYHTEYRYNPATGYYENMLVPNN